MIPQNTRKDMIVDIVINRIWDEKWRENREAVKLAIIWVTPKILEDTLFHTDDELIELAAENGYIAKSKLDDRRLVTKAVSKRGENLLHTNFINDKEMLKLAIDTYPEIIKYSNLKHDRDIIMYAIMSHKYTKIDLGEFLNDDTVMKFALSINGFYIEDTKYSNNREFSLIAVKSCGESIKYTAFCDDLEVAISAYNNSKKSVFYTCLRNYKKYVMEAALSLDNLYIGVHRIMKYTRFNNDDFLVKYVDLVKQKKSNYYDNPICIDNRELLIRMVRLDGMFFNNTTIFKDREIMKIAIKTSPRVLIGSKYIDDYELVSDAVESDGSVLIHSCWSSDRSLVLKAIKSTPSIFESIDPKFYDDREVVLTVLKFSYNVLRYATKFRNDPEIVMEVLKEFPCAICYSDLIHDRDFILNVIHIPHVIKYTRFIDDYDIAMELARRNIPDLKYSTFYDDWNVALEAIKINPSYIENTYNLKKDTEFISTAISADHGFSEYFKQSRKIK